MLVTAEIRWFWKGAAPAGLEEWFRSELASAGETRVDRYLRDTDELGIKLRGGGKGVELKGLVAEDVGRSTAAPFRGPIQLWAKWTSEALRLPRRLIAVEKTRWLRAFGKCNVELTRIELSRGRVWWTLGFEAVGGADVLRRTAALLARKKPPRLTGGRLSSYPAWLARSERLRRT